MAYAIVLAVIVIETAVIVRQAVRARKVRKLTKELKDNLEYLCSIADPKSERMSGDEFMKLMVASMNDSAMSEGKEYARRAERRGKK